MFIYIFIICLSLQIIWDVINMLSFYQEKQPQNIIKGYRSIQAKLQLNWLNIFFVKTNVPWSFKGNLFIVIYFLRK